MATQSTSEKTNRITSLQPEKCKRTNYVKAKRHNTDKQQMLSLWRKRLDCKLCKGMKQAGSKGI